MSDPDRLVAIYHVRGTAAEIDARAKAIAVEQSIEMPVAAVDDAYVLDHILGRVDGVRALGDGRFEVRVALAAATVGADPGQLLNMLFGNSSIQDDLTLHDVELPPALAAAFAGPRHGIRRLRRLCGAEGRAMTCGALKPQGLPPARLADLFARFADGGVDFVKDDHGMADQAYAPFTERARAVARAMRAAGGTHYFPSLSGTLDDMRAQAHIAREEGIAGVLVAPFVAGVAAFHALVRGFPELVFMAHPALAGAARIAPPLLLGRLLRLFGADASVFPNHGGRFGYTPATCAALADAAREPWHDLAPTLPVPAGGMSLERVPEMLDFYGRDVLLLIGGNLLLAGERLAEAAAAFARMVAGHSYGERR